MFLQKASISKISKYIDTLSLAEDELLSIFLGQKINFQLTSLVNTLNKKNIIFWGGVFPGLIFEQEIHENGCIILQQRFLKKPKAIDINKGEIDADFLNISSKVSKTIFCLADGYSNGIRKSLRLIHNLHGNVGNYLGAGAGFGNKPEKASLFSNEGCFKNTTLFSILNIDSKLDFGHGFHKLAGPLIVSKAKDNCIHELNWDNAKKVYLDVIESHSTIQYKKEAFSKFIQLHPFGVYREDSDFVIKDIFEIKPSGSIKILDRIEENTILYIMTATNEKLLDISKNLSVSSEKKKGKKTNFIINCISRLHLLEDEFNKEIKNIYSQFSTSSNNQNTYGLLSIGEIASDGEGMVLFQNKTLVLATLTSS